MRWGFSLLGACGFALLSGCANAPLLSNSGLLSATQKLKSNSTSTLSVKAAQNKPFNPFIDNSTTDIKLRQVIENPTIDQVMQPGPLTEMSLGRVDAPVTIIKYASMTCPYCRKFQIETFPILKREYINTGKVRYILREFPIGFQSGAATIALRCAPASKYFTLYDKLIRNQRLWVSQKVRREPIFQIAKQIGLSRADFNACFADNSLSEKLSQIKERGRTLGVIGTPNYFINGRLYKRRLTTRDIHNLVREAFAKAPLNAVE